MSAVQLKTPVEGQFLQITPEKKLRFVNGAWRIHTNNVPVSEHSPVPAMPPIRSEEAPALSVQNPFWQKTSTGELFYKYQDESLVWSWKEIGEDPPAFPLVAENPPALPNTNPFWQKTSTGQLYFQKKDSEGVASWELVGEDLPAFPLLSEEPPALPNTNPFWQKLSTGKLYFQKKDSEGVASWELVGEDLPFFPLLSETAPALPNANPFWQKTSTGQLFFQYANGYGDTAWRPVQNEHRYDLSVAVTTSVLDFGINQVFKVDNTTASVKSLVVQNAPANRSMTVPVIVMGKVGTVNFPAGINWDQGKVPTLSDTKTTLIFFWDGTALTGSKGHSY